MMKKIRLCTTANQRLGQNRQAEDQQKVNRQIIPIMAQAELKDGIMMFQVAIYGLEQSFIWILIASIANAKKLTEILDMRIRLDHWRLAKNISL